MDKDECFDPSIANVLRVMLIIVIAIVFLPMLTATFKNLMSNNGTFNETFPFTPDVMNNLVTTIILMGGASVVVYASFLFIKIFVLDSRSSRKWSKVEEKEDADDFEEEEPQRPSLSLKDEGQKEELLSASCASCGSRISKRDYAVGKCSKCGRSFE